MAGLAPVARSGLQRIRKHMVVAEESGPPIRILLNSNESAFGPSKSALAALRSAAGHTHRYIEDQDRVLVPALAERYGLDPARIAIGCGSDDLLVRLCRAYLEPRTELVRSANSYLKVPNYAYSNDAVPVSAVDKEFAMQPESMLAAVTGRTRIVYVANPDNPSGSYLGNEAIRTMHGELPGNVLLILDCAYFEYIDSDDPADMLGLVEQSDNVVVTRTFSKVHGLAGARVGWLYGPPHVVEVVEKLRYTFPIATPSLHAALAALEDREHPVRVAEENRRLRASFGGRFAAMGARVHPSQGNFLLLEFNDSDRTAELACNALRHQGIAVRRFTSHAYRRCLRVTLGREDELAAALEVLTEHLRTCG